MISYRYPALAAFALATAIGFGQVQAGTPTRPQINLPRSAAATPKESPVPSPIIPGADIVHFSSSIGSFKLLGSDTTPVAGKMDMHFSGTVLVSGLKGGSVVTNGTVHLEKETSDHSRKVYFGTGEIICTGQLRSFQFFGKDVSGTFKGVGIFRLFGEFDKKLQTGFIWYDGEDKRPWGTGGNQIVVPNPQATAPNARVRVHSAG